MDDIELLQRYAVEGCQDSFAALVRRHVHLVYGTARRLVRQPQTAEDITQSVFTTLARKANDFPRSAIIAGWLYRATVLASKHLLRTEGRRADREMEASFQLAQPPEGPLDDLMRLLDEALLRLPETDRTLLVLRYFENKSSQEIARITGSSEVVARKRVSRALEKLRQKLGPPGGKISLGALALSLGMQSTNAAPASLIASLETLNAAAPASPLVQTLMPLMMPKASGLLTGSVVLALLTSALWVGGLFWKADPHKECHARLDKVYAAIQAYRKDHQQLPHYLRELYPRYVTHPQGLFCPDVRPGEKTSDNLYMYEFHQDRIPPLFLKNKDWKELQMKRVGGKVPILRCHQHGETWLNIGIDGGYYQSELSWENHPDIVAILSPELLKREKLMERYQVKVPFVAREEAMAEAAKNQSKIQVQKIDIQARQHTPTDALSSYALVLHYFTGEPVPRFFEIFCRENQIPFFDAREAEAKALTYFFETSSKDVSLSAYEILLSLHATSSEPFFVTARERCTHHFYPSANETAPQLEHILENEAALLSIQVEFDDGRHAVTVFHNGARFLVRDTRFEGFYEIASLTDLGALRECVLFRAKPNIQ